MLIFAWGNQITETAPVRRKLHKNKKGCVIWDGKSTVSQVYQCNLSPHLVSGCLGNTMETLAAEE